MVRINILHTHDSVYLMVSGVRVQQWPNLRSVFEKALTNRMEKWKMHCGHYLTTV